MCVHTYIHTYTAEFANTMDPENLGVEMPDAHTHIHAHVCTYIHKYIHTYIHTYILIL